ncbi:hypothetical protein [Amycolatopsis palatopharyngis]|uniref:hypothetical protein n=1 Tax=Amycolatopsis palatopharyngis TaxID=187982 RepID=UPI000E25A0D5|nr:hypothetical protein [Amycolatopsis palatopharyngis]
MIDLNAAARFMTTHARLLDRRRFDLLTGKNGPQGPLAALAGYRNDDGGYGNALEPDLRSAGSQPVSALHAFEVFEEVAPVASEHAAHLCDWLASSTLADGGLPFALPVPDPAGCAPFFVQADSRVSSLHMTCMLAAIAHRIGRHDPVVREHRWLTTATAYSLQRIRELEGPGHALEYRFALQFLDATHDILPGADAELHRLGAWLPESGILAVEGGTDGEAMRPLDFAPVPDRPLRALFSESAIQSELDSLESAQQPDGGWTVDWDSQSPAGALEWRGWATVRALTILKANARPTP